MVGRFRTDRRRRAGADAPAAPPPAQLRERAGDLDDLARVLRRLHRSGSERRMRAFLRRLHDGGRRR